MKKSNLRSDSGGVGSHFRVRFPPSTPTYCTLGLVENVFDCLASPAGLFQYDLNLFCGLFSQLEAFFTGIKCPCKPVILVRLDML